MQEHQEHPLQNKWTWYYHTKGAYQDETHVLREVDTIEGFWRVQNTLCEPHEFDRIHGMSVFRGDIKPEWEHPSNVGGCDIFARDAMDCGWISEAWLGLLLDVIGGTLPHAETITGVRAVHKMSKDTALIRVEVWFGETTPACVETVAKEIEERGSVHKLNHLHFVGCRSHGANAYPFSGKPDKTFRKNTRPPRRTPGNEPTQ